MTFLNRIKKYAVEIIFVAFLLCLFAGSFIVICRPILYDPTAKCSNNITTTEILAGKSYIVRRCFEENYGIPIWTLKISVFNADDKELVAKRTADVSLLENISPDVLFIDDKILYDDHSDSIGEHSITFPITLKDWLHVHIWFYPEPE